MTKRYLKTPEEVIDALQAGKAVFDFNGYRYKMYKGCIFWKDGKQWEVASELSYSYGLFIEEPEPLKLEVGKFYKTRDGRKAWIMECTDMKGTFPFRVATQRECSMYVITKDGRRYFEDTDGTDLVAPWEE